MGFPRNIFVENIDEDYCCTICLDVVQDPLQCKDCESLFCNDCYETLIQKHNKCPNCQKPLQVQKVPRLVGNAINRLIVKCRNNCGQQVALEHLCYHEYEECQIKQVHESCKRRVEILQKECQKMQSEQQKALQELNALKQENLLLNQANQDLKIQIIQAKVTSMQSVEQKQDMPEKLLQGNLLGILKQSNSTFIGEIKNNQANGFGLKVLTNGVKVIGEFQNNVSHGRSSWISSDGQEYSITDRIKGTNQGWCISYFSDGSYYQGQQINGKRHGIGLEMKPDGTVIQGEWAEGRRIK